MRFCLPAASRPRRYCALAGALSITAGLVLFPLAAGPASAAPTSSAAAAGTHAASAAQLAAESAQEAATKSRRTVQGQKLWDPKTHHQFKVASSVTVSQTTELTNQEVLVTWKHFTPSSEEAYQPQTEYPVMVAECKGTHPKSPSQCFGAQNGGVAGSFSAFGPMNTSYATSAKNGTGETQIQLLTGQQDQQLACDIGVPCSLAIVPSQGGNNEVFPTKCSDHSVDSLTSTGPEAFGFVGQCSWKKRIIVPLFFAPNPADCPVANANFTAIGSPMLSRAMGQWQSALCASSDQLSIQYDSAQSEPLARQDFLDGSDDIALTTLPASGTGKHPFTYAPLAVSAVSVAYWIDNPKTGRPLSNLRFDPRLIVKLLTQSYDFDNEGCGNGPPPPGVGCDNGVDNNPVTMFDDPEFKRLNPHVAAVGDGYQVPTVVSGQSDMTTTVTRWIAANKDAKSFVDGSFDPFGMHVNTAYLNLQLPTNSFASMDAYPLIAHRYSPVFPLSQVAQYQADNWYPATNWQQNNLTGNFDKLVPELTGNRALFAIMDEGDSAEFLLPSAALLNSAGKYVKPSRASMAAAVSEMTTAKNHITQQMPVNGKAKNAYPLTMVIYAMVPTGGISQQKAAKIAQFLDFVAGRGQQPGNLPGDLPPGFLPLNAKQRAQTLAAAQAVLDQSGAKHHGSGSGPAPGASPSPSPTPSAAASPAPTPTPSASQHVVSLGFVSNPASSGLGRFALPFLLIAGGLLALAGSSMLVAGRTSTAVAARLRRLRLQWRSKP